MGGLAAGVSLRRAGHEVTLVEQSSRFGDVGAGIQLAPNATRVLRRLGLLDAVAGQAARPARFSFRTWSDGAEICGWTLGRAAEDAFGAPYLQVHRADLHHALAAALPAEPGALRLNTVVVGIDQDKESAYVTTAGGERLRADLVVAADGIRSAARRWLFGADEAVFSRTAAYRALLPADGVADLRLPDTGVWLGPGRHFVHYWVRRGELLNVVAVFGTRAAARESWTARAEPGEQLHAFAGWDPRVLGVLERAGRVFRHGIYSRAPLARWNVGRVTLLGDSAHAMVPFQAQGAAQAILDAAVLGDALMDATPAEVPEALDRYVRRRLTTATGVQAGSARAGEDFHLPDGPEARARNARMAAQTAENEFGPLAATWAADADRGN
ncbi:FAD-dependent monooxygenase [Streptomyces sp. ME18-1-4]|uniref:FAD-dependent monooxygenase n=1 Tax=Streptomyces sp. ME18-1-4 TaxID=3028685 RepID=UPI0029B7084C|nr:FAD-dependent monooxygenase [Streptomyces sp. ME18-1-4]MDX3241337.1 FAD-dependent monooxygenase [Streptomyces sp. ME18-1-4]